MQRVSSIEAAIAAGSIVVLMAMSTAAAAEAAVSSDEASLTREQARELHNPVPFSKESIRLGGRDYLRLCQICHGADGKALENIDFEATNLTEPDFYLSGATDGDIFFSTKEGAGFEMPAFRDKLDDVQLWQIVNFIRSIGPLDWRPDLVEEP